MTFKLLELTTPPNLLSSWLSAKNGLWKTYKCTFNSETCRKSVSAFYWQKMEIFEKKPYFY